MNGLPLPAAHGGPLRLVLPGFYSVNSVKWLSRLTLEKRPTPNHYQSARYRVPKVRLTPGQDFVFTEENSRPDWLQNVKSFIWAPLDGERLRPGPLEIRGPAWTAGRSLLGGVELSLDRGRSWRSAELDMSTSPFSWRLWRLPVVLEAGAHDLWARAFDASGNRQPLDGTEFWNPSGYEWNGVHKIRVTVG
jgi:DMSO/TMAO reductase YedYZ molybdopterin-dependent catalytic subunit